jgi:hypothetical protein
MSRILNKIAGTFYGYLFYKKRMTYEEACKALTTPFKMYAYQCRWFRYRMNEDSKYECLLPEEVWSDEMIDPETGKHHDDCDGYAAAAIDPLTKGGVDCEILCVMFQTVGHATLLMHEKKQERTIGTYGLWCHKKKSIPEICKEFVVDETGDVECFYLTDREWNVTAYGQLMDDGTFEIAKIE